MLRYTELWYWVVAALIMSISHFSINNAHAESSATIKKTAVNLTVQMDVQEKSAKERRPVTPGETLHAGDKLVLRIEVDRKAYVRVLQMASGQRVAPIFPPPGSRELEALIEPGIQTLIPSGGDALELDEDLGPESFVVIASAEPLSAADPALSQRLSAATAPPVVPPPPVKLDSASAPPPAPPPPPPPPPPPFPITTDERRWLIKVPGKPYVVRVKAFPSGVALARFGYQHGAAAPSQAKTK